MQKKILFRGHELVYETGKGIARHAGAWIHWKTAGFGTRFIRNGK